MLYVVIRKVRPYDTTTLNYNWQVWDTQAFSLYTTTTTHIDQNGPTIMKSQVVYDTELVSVRTSESGIFEPLTYANTAVIKLVTA